MPDNDDNRRPLCVTSRFIISDERPNNGRELENILMARLERKAISILPFLIASCSIRRSAHTQGQITAFKLTINVSLERIKNLFTFFRFSTCDSKEFSSR